MKGEQNLLHSTQKRLQKNEEGGVQLERRSKRKPGLWEERDSAIAHLLLVVGDDAPYKVGLGLAECMHQLGQLLLQKEEGEEGGGQRRRKGREKEVRGGRKGGRRGSEEEEGGSEEEKGRDGREEVVRGGKVCTNKLFPWLDALISV